MEDLKGGSFVAPDLPPPGYVSIGGMTTSIEAAVAAGLIDAADLPAAATGDHPLDQRRAQALAQRSADRLAGRMVAPTSPSDTGQQQQQQQAAGGDAPTATDGAGTDLSPATTEAVTAASAALQSAADAVGADVVERSLATVADTGELPTHLPDGVTREQAEAAMAGYVASANHHLSSTGATVDTLSEMLTGDELVGARRCAVAGDAEGMRHFGQMAQDRLAKLPYADPSRFTALMEDVPANLRPVKTQDNWYFRLEDGSEIGWETAIRTGRVKFGG